MDSDRMPLQRWRALMPARHSIRVQSLGTTHLPGKPNVMTTLTIHGGTRAITAQLSLHVLNALRFGARRFGELGRLVNVRNPSVLSKHMRKLERDGVVERIQVRGSNGIEYRLTPLGADMQRAAAPLLAWVKENEPHVLANRE